MNVNAESAAQQKAASSVTLETIIAMSLFGWLALSVTLMGLGIW